MKTRIGLVWGLWLLSAAWAQAQLAPQGGRHRVGIMVGYGDQTGIDVNYRYEALFMQAQYGYTFVRKKNWYVEAVAQPQYNLTEYRPLDSLPTLKSGYEAGVNLGAAIGLRLLLDRLRLYVLLSAGPHYVSGTPERQISGFIFSDNAFLGLQIRVCKRLYLDLRPGFRHISNASIKRPNGGVNTSIINIGAWLSLL